MDNYLVKAIRKLKPNAEFSFTDDDYSTIKWDVLDGEAPTQKEIDAAIKEVKADEAQAEATKATQRQTILDRLGITAEEAQLLLS
jgi:acyl-CoA reductase-like NAD-dependent aldehyde dehydrogenase